MKSFKLHFTILFILFLNNVYAVKPLKVQPDRMKGLSKNFINHKDWSFVENKGQLEARTPKGDDRVSDIKYYSHEGEAQIYCRPGKISFVFSEIINEQNEVSEATGTSVRFPLPKGAGGFGRTNFNHHNSLTTSRLDLILLHSNPSAQITASDQQEYYENFYLPHCGENGITNVHTYKTITYKNIYPQIDMVLHCKQSGMKYEFVVYTGGKVSDIQMQWAGIERIKRLKNLGIKYSFALGQMEESKPYTYQDSKEIVSSFRKEDNIIGFKTGKYDRNKPLVIDPTLDWSTYFGGPKNEQSSSLAVDSKDNLYVGGSTQSASGIASAGAYQTSFSGENVNGFIAKFSTSGSRIWSTYFGGNGTGSGMGGEFIAGISLDLFDNVVICGSTSSDSGISSTGAYQTSYGGGFDAFIAKFSSTGSRTWSTYFGGTNPDQGEGVTTDKIGNIYITGATQSTSNIATSGAYQSSFIKKTLSNNYGYAFIAKFTSQGGLIWSTYFGGNRSDEGERITIDVFGDVLISGFTNSSTGIATSGAYQTINYDNYNDFIAKFSASGARIWSTYYGTVGNFGGSRITSDLTGNIFITGTTDSFPPILSAGAYQTSYGGGYSDVFIAKFSPSGTRLWGTYFGGSGVDEGTSLIVDTLGNLYISGLTSSTSNIATLGAFQTTYGGGQYDGFIAKFSPSGKRLWGTYFGSTGSDFVDGIKLDHNQNICITGTTTSTTGIATSGAYQTNYGGNNDVFIAKFDSRFTHDIGARFTSGVDSICQGQNGLIVINLINYGLDTFVSATVHWSVNGKMQNSVVWSGSILPKSSRLVKLGFYKFLNDNDTIVAWTSLKSPLIDPNPENDTGKLIAHFYKSHFAGAGQNSYTICTGTHVKIGTDGVPGNTYLWASNPQGFNSTLSNPIVNPNSFTTFLLTETNTLTGCVNSDSSAVIVKVAKAPVASPGFDQTICKGGTGMLGADPLGGITYSWTSNPPGFTSTAPKAGVQPDTTTTYYLSVTNTNGCSDLGKVTIYVYSPPNIHAGLSQKVCSGTVVQLGEPPVSGYVYSWSSNPVGFNSTISNPVIIADSTRIYYLRVTISTTNCTATDSVLINVVPKPIVKIKVDSIDVFTRTFIAENPNYPASLYKWNINNADRATGYSITHTFSKIGNYEVTLTTEIPGYCMSTDSLNIEINPPFYLNIFPNPFATQTDIQYILPGPAHIRISIVDMLGREVTTLLDKNLDIGEYNTKFDGSHLNTRPGMYIVVFMRDDKMITRKVVQWDSEFY